MNDTFWMIEHFDHNQPAGHRWLRIWTLGSVNGIPRGELTWTEEPLLGLRFSRQEDAQMFALLHPEWCTLAKITSHGLMSADGVAPTTETALARFKEMEADTESGLASESPLERLRYFLSLALNGQDWLDVEPFLDAIGVPVPAPILGYRVDASYFQKWESIPKALRYKAIPLVAAAGVSVLDGQTVSATDADAHTLTGSRGKS